jgi:hypothetical protein
MTRTHSFIRFVGVEKVDGTSSRVGFLYVAYQVRKYPFLAQETITKINTILDWFKDHLDRPDRFNASKSKGAWRRNSHGISWFKSHANDHIKKARELSKILNEHGYKIEEIKTARPGYIVYEDDFQIVAEPFSDTLT